jgi:hypothetical protein
MRYCRVFTRKVQEFILLLTLCNSQFCSCTHRGITVVSSKLDSTDLVGTGNAECTYKFPYAMQTASMACDFNMATHVQGANPYPSTASLNDKTFFVKWLDNHVIAAFMVDAYPTMVNCNVYITDRLPIDRSDPDLLAFSNIYLDGVFNLGTPMEGNVLAFTPTSAQNQSNFAVREIRVWSNPDVA